MDITLKTLLLALSFQCQIAGAAVPDQHVMKSESVQAIPPLGFGTWNLQKSNGSQAVAAAIETGFRHIDAAAIYGNENETGRGIAEGMHRAGISRRDLWVTSKLWNTAHDADAVPRALDATLAALRLDYLDLYLMHWPVAARPDGHHAIDFLDTWRALEAAHRAGKARHIGVSNFSPAQLRALLAHARVAPYAHQFEAHPYLPQDEFLEMHARHGIHVTAYSPLGNTNPTYSSVRKQGAGERVPRLLGNPVVEGIAEARGCTPAQVALAWGLERGTSVIPKATTPEHIKEDFEAPKCKLEDDDFAALAKLPVKRFNNPSKSWGVKLFEGLEDSQALGQSSILVTLSGVGLKMLGVVKDSASFLNEATTIFRRPRDDL